jgi:hypothetical protein
MKSILNKDFRYTPSAETDLRKTFARVRREQKAREEQAAAVAQEAKLKVSSLVRELPAGGKL